MQKPVHYKVYAFTDFIEIREKIDNNQIEEPMETWKEVQTHKYDGDLYLGDMGSHEFIFRHIELPLIEMVYPKDLVYEKVKSWVSYLRARAKARRDATSFDGLRKMGVPFSEASKHAPNGMYDQLANGYSQPFRLRYKLSSADADALYQMGLDSFIKNFYDRFYVPISNVGNQRGTARSRG